MAPTLAPELKMPVASERSLCGNHSAVVLMAAGKLPDSPRPRQKRAMPNCSTVLAKCMAHGGEAPDGHDDHVADARAELVDQAAGGQKAERVGDLKCVDDISVVEFGHADACSRVGLRMPMTWRSM